MMEKFCLLSVLLAHAVTAIPNIPKPTNAKGILDPQGWSPRPTGAPHFDLMRRDLSPRQLSYGQLVGYFAPDATCGYVNGKLGAPITCSSASRCAAIAPVGGSPGELGCCPTGGDGSCVWYGTCYNYADIYTYSKCDHACQQDTNVILCTRTSFQFCYGYTLPGLSATAYGCDTTTGIDTVLTTWIGETDGRSYSTFYNTLSGSSGSSFPVHTTTGISSTTSSSSSTTTTPFGQTTTPDPKPSTPVGAIVGGVVGGIAVISAVVVGIIFLVVRNRRKKRADAAAAAAAAAGGGGGGGMPPPQPQMMQSQQMAPQPMGGPTSPHDPRMSYYGQQPQDMKQPMNTISSPGSPAPAYNNLSPAMPNSPQYHPGQPQSPVYPPPQNSPPPELASSEPPPQHFELPGHNQ